MLQSAVQNFKTFLWWLIVIYYHQPLQNEFSPVLLLSIKAEWSCTPLQDSLQHSGGGSSEWAEPNVNGRMDGQSQLFTSHIFKTYSTDAAVWRPRQYPDHFVIVQYHVYDYNWVCFYLIDLDYDVYDWHRLALVSIPAACLKVTLLVIFSVGPTSFSAPISLLHWVNVIQCCVWKSFLSFNIHPINCLS